MERMVCVFAGMGRSQPPTLVQGIKPLRSKIPPFFWGGGGNIGPSKIYSEIFLLGDGVLCETAMGPLLGEKI